MALPLAGAAILLFGADAPVIGPTCGCAAALAAFGVGAMLLATCSVAMGRARDPSANFTWIPAGGLQVGFGLQIDQLSSRMLLISGVGSADSPSYSVGYGRGPRHPRRFFGYPNLFLWPRCCCW